VKGPKGGRRNFAELIREYLGLTDWFAEIGHSKCFEPRLIKSGLVDRLDQREKSVKLRLLSLKFRSSSDLVPKFG